MPPRCHASVAAYRTYKHKAVRTLCFAPRITRSTKRQSKQDAHGEDHGLPNGDGPVDVRESLELVVLVAALDVVLLDVVEALLLTPQLDDEGVVDDGLSKLHHLFVVRCREQQQLTVTPQASGKLQQIKGSVCSVIHARQHGRWILVASINWEDRVDKNQHKQKDRLSRPPSDNTKVGKPFSTPWMGPLGHHPPSLPMAMCLMSGGTNYMNFVRNLVLF